MEWLFKNTLSLQLAWYWLQLSVVSQDQDLQGVQQQLILALHNVARAQVGVGELEWNDTVAAHAKNYANQRKADCSLQHSGGPYGENIFEETGFDYAIKSCVTAWVEERQYYDYSSNSCSEGQVCGHYTQVVWNDSVRLGCAQVQCNNSSWIFFICNYDPPGNIIGQRPYEKYADKNLVARGNFGQVFFDYKVLRDSTGNFDRNKMIGKGGFGEVYKGRLPDGRDVAVKKLNGKQTTQAVKEFLTEVKLITSVRHRNLVRLLGCCTRGHKRLLVYEFMPNNSLDKHLFGEIRDALSWENRVNIIVGTARGLAYLHGDSNVRIIHRDIKCANILLDDKFLPKIADFGLARFFPENQTHVSTRVGGTIGYTAPEYAVHGQLTEKADVYSYGIVVLEIVSGRKCVDVRLPARLQLVLEWNACVLPRCQLPPYA